MTRIRSALRYSNVMATFAVFLALGGAAFAVSKAPKNSVVSPSIKNGAVTGKDVKDDSLSGADIDEASLALDRAGNARPTGAAGGDLAGSYPNPTVGPNAVGSAEVADGSLTAADVDESSLTEVKVARQGGIGRYGFDGSCDPDGASLIPCATTSIRLDTPGRLLVTATVEAEAETPGTAGFGVCVMVVESEQVGASITRLGVFRDAENDQRTLSAVTDVLPAGMRQVGIVCNEHDSGNWPIRYPRVRQSVVALSAG